MYTKEQLEAKTVKELKKMCVDVLGIPGMTKKNKGIIINAILEHYNNSDDVKEVEKVEESTEIPEINIFVKSHKRPFSNERGNNYSSTIYMTSGVVQGNYHVVGKTIKKALEVVGDILNADIKSTPIVNGNIVGMDYVLKEGDVCEFLKPAGKKG